MNARRKFQSQQQKQRTPRIIARNSFDAASLVKSDSSLDEPEEDLSETINASVYGVTKFYTNYSLEPCIWSRECLLKKHEKQALDAKFPHGLSEHSEFTLIGKARIKLSQSGKLTDKIGQVKKSTCVLDMCHSNRCHEFEKFVVLNFANPACFYWASVDLNLSQIPSNALRLGYETVSHSVLYAGRSTTIKNCKLIGSIMPNSNSQLSVIYKNEVIQCKTFEVLCLKFNPLSLKNICRQKIRYFLNHDNEKIENLEFFLEPSLIKYTKISNKLKFGRELRCNEFLISRNKKYKLSLTVDGRLLYFPSPTTSDYLFLYDKVESLWFHELGVVVCFEDMKAGTFLDNLDNMNANFKDAKMVVANDGLIKIRAPLFEFKIMAQFRNDLASLRNGAKAKFEFTYYFEKTPLAATAASQPNNEDMFNNDSDFDSSDSDSESSDSNDSDVDCSNLKK